MDMSVPYKKAVHTYFGSRAKKIIAYDHFHITKMLAEALDYIRKKELQAAPSIDRLYHHKTRFIWLQNKTNRDDYTNNQITEQAGYLQKTATAWFFKERFREIWKYAKKGHKRLWQHWIELVRATGLKPLIGVASTIEENLEGILNAQKYGVSNGRAEALNNNIKYLARRSRGYKNRERYKSAIWFNFGRLDLHPTH